MKKNLKKNYIYNLSYQILIIITPLITTPYISRTLGAEGIGINSYIESIASYFMLFAGMGASLYGQREMSYYQDDKKKRTTIFWEIKIITFITTLCMGLLYGCFYFFVSDRNILYVIYAINFLNVIVDITWLYQGLEEFGIITLRNIVLRVINIIYVFLMVKTPEDVELYAIGLLVVTLVGNILMWINIGRLIDRPRVCELHPLRHLKGIIELFIPTIAVQVYLVLDKTMIGLITDSSHENGYYDQAMKIAKIALTVVTAVSTVLVPRIAYYYEQKLSDKIEDLMYKAFNLVWLLGIPMCAGLIAVSPNFVPWFFGTGYDKVVDLLQIFSFLILAIGINTLTGGVYMIATKKQSQYTSTVIIGATVNLIINMLLIARFKSSGAAIASVIAESTIAISQLFFIRNNLSIKKVFATSRNYLFAAVVMFVVIHKIEGYLCPCIIHTFVLVFIGILVYGVLLLIMRDKFLLQNIRNILDKIVLKRKGV